MRRKSQGKRKRVEAGLGRRAATRRNKINQLIFVLVTLAEAFDAPFGVDQFGIAGVKGMAGAAGVDPHLRRGRHDFLHVTASTFDGGRTVFWMDICFHDFVPVNF
jgi:hypothetical protein